MKLSKNLTDILDIKGDNNSIKKLLKSLKDNDIKINYVKCPKSKKTVKEINSFVDEKWKNTSNDDRNVLVAEKKPTRIFIIYSNDGLTYTLRKICEDIEIKVDHIFLSSGKESAIIISEKNCTGAEIEKIIITKMFYKKNYSIGMCFNEIEKNENI